MGKCRSQFTKQDNCIPAMYQALEIWYSANNEIVPFASHK